MGALEILFIIMIISTIITIITIMIIISEQGCNSATGWWPVRPYRARLLGIVLIPAVSCSCACGDTDSGRGILHCPTYHCSVGLLSFP